MARDAVKTDWRRAFFRLLWAVSRALHEPEDAKAMRLLREGVEDCQTAAAANLP